MMELSQEQINTFVIAAHHDFDAVKTQLAAQPALLNENAEWFETPIQAAAHTGQRAIAEYLLEQGAPLDICTASMLGRAADVRAMLAEAPDLIGANGAHHIPLMYFAAIGASIEIAQLLVDAGADINVGVGGNTALHGAAGFGRTEMVKWLLGHGADPAATDYNGKTPLEIAHQTGHTAAAELIGQAITVYEAILDAEDAAAEKAASSVDALNADAPTKDDV